jgi:hypothetical protein
MIKKLSVLFSVAFLFNAMISYAQTDKLMYDRLLKSQVKGFYQVPVGLCEDYPEETTTMEIIRKDMQFLKSNDVKFLRISFGWDAIEAQKDKYTWLFWDDFVKIAVEEYGITLIPYICYTPDWNSTAKGDPMKFWNHTPVDYEEFGQFIKDLVTRYRKWIKSWELWNEPDIKAFWSGTAQELAKLTKIGSRAVREADPEAIVVLAGLAHRTEFTRELFRDHDIGSYVDVINIHNYYETWHPASVEAVIDYVNEIYGIVKKYGNNQPVWMAEVGYSTWRMGGNKVSDHYTAYYDYEHTPAYQAVDLFKRVALVASTGKISAIAWYELKDLLPAEDVIGDNNNRNLGVAYVDHSPKPAIQALKFFNHILSGKYLCINNRVMVKKKADSDSEVLVFEEQIGNVIVVSWLRTSIPGKREEETSGMVKDERNETIEIEIPGVLNGKARLYDELGQSAEFLSVFPEQTHTVIKNIQLKGGAISIIKIEK